MHFSRNALAHAGKSGRCVVSAFIATAYAQETPEAAKTQWRKVADQLRPNVPKLAKLMDTAEEDVLAYMSFPPQHRTKLHSTDEIDKTSRAKMCYGALARATSWRRAELRLQVPPGRLFTALPAWSVRAPWAASAIERRNVHMLARRVGRFPFPDLAVP